MTDSFGELLRKLRRKEKKTLDDIAQLLGVSIVYLSDIERGNRKPLSDNRIVRVAAFLNSDPTELLKAANKERGFIEYDIQKSDPLAAGVVSGLVAGLARGGISEDQLRKMQQIIEETELT